ncbi:MAG: hypothetical protein MUP16_00830 [Sedimentisphaerales bacterium]|nr:hypothetical protein [Sedimentisphaerales bacterium]
MKKLTLNQTWVLCLRMWKWIARVWIKGDDVNKLKKEWWEKHGFSVSHLSSGNCFFCNSAGYKSSDDCVRCPGKKIDKDFDCMCEEYDYEEKPKAFYAKLLRLDKIRRGKP